MDKFNLQGYLKNNQLLNESIGGYVDMKPMKEELGTAMGEEDLGYAKHGGDFSDDDSEFGGGYIQSFGPKFEEALNLMDEAFIEWRSGPMTRKEDIRPAIIELITRVKEHFLNYRP
jgi:hypothetical protein